MHAELNILCISGFWDVATGMCDVIQGKGHTNQIMDMKVMGDRLYTIGMDDHLFVSDANTRTYG